MCDESTPKRCPKCGQGKPLSEFNKNRSRPDGLQTYCRPCQRASGAASDAKHRDGRRAYYRANRAQIIARATAWNRANIERRREIVNAYNTRNRPRAHAYYIAHRDTIKQHVQSWRETHRESYRKHRRDYRLRYPEKHAEKQRRRNARKRGSVFERVDYAAILERDGSVCHICGREVASADMSFDHVIPLARGGSHTADNIKVAHMLCNVRKGVRLPDAGG